jgi:dTDP-4-dehydrorhamnose 3,5-epimerase
MKVRATRLAGVFVVEPRIHDDARGRFSTHFDADAFRAQGLVTGFGQTATSRNVASGTLRGMHWQDAPFEQTKLVRCSRGAVHDVVLDLRPQSATYRGWLAVELSEDNELALYIPVGCAHGYQTLREDSWLTYQIDGPYSPDHARGVRWDDPAFNIEWPACDSRVLADRDLGYADFGSNV